MRADGFDVVLVGAQLPGLIAAKNAAREGRTVDVLLSDRSLPTESRQADDLWLHSGLLGPGELLDRRWYYEGLKTLRYFGFGRPRSSGLLSLAEREVSSYQDRATSLRISKEFRRLEYAEARERLGAFFEEGLAYFDIPDAMFPAAELMQEARDQAVAEGVRFHEGPVSLEPSRAATNGYLIRFGETLIDPAVALISATSITPELVASLGLDRDLSLRRSVQIEVDDSYGLPTLMLADVRAGMVVISWSRVNHPPRGRFIVARSRCRIVGANAKGLALDSTREQEAAILSYLPSGIPLATLRHRFSASPVHFKRSAGRASASDSHYAPKAFPGLIFAMPGPPTSALVQARKVVSVIRRIPFKKATVLSGIGDTSRTSVKDASDTLSHDSDYVRKGNESDEQPPLPQITQRISA